MSNKQSVQSPIARRLIIYIILFSSFITLVITVIQLYRDYRADMTYIELEFEQIETIHLNSLTSALWATNRKLLQTSIEGILNMRDIQHVEIRDQKMLWAEAGKLESSNYLQQSYEMVYQYNNRSHNIGKLIVSISLDGAYQRLINKIWAILTANAIKTSFVAFFIYFLFVRMVTRHLSAISEFSKDIKPGTAISKLVLQRNNKKHDELDAVVGSINKMHKKLHQQITELNQQKQYLSLTLNSIGDAVIATDVSGNITRMNPVAEQLTGWSFEEVQGKNLRSAFSIIDASTRKPIDNPVDKVIASGETIYLSNHTTLIAKNGREFQIADSAAPILDHDKILGMVLVFNDVTEQYQLRQAVAKSEKKYHTLASVAPVGIFFTDIEGNCLYVNEMWCQLAGMSATEAIGKGWQNTLHPDDQEIIFAEWQQTTQQGTQFKLEYRFQQNNQVRWVLGQAIAEVDNKGQIIGYIGTITDITDLKEAQQALIKSEKKLRLIHSQVPGIVYQFRIDKKGKRFLPYVSPAVETYIGLTTTEVMEDAETWFELTHPDDYPGLEKSILNSMKDLSIWKWQGRFIKKDGQSVWLSGISTPERMADGSTVWNGLFLDVTERVHANETIRRTLKMDALGKLTGGIAHDYNNMLGVVLGYAELLTTQLKQQPQLQEYAERISHAGERGAKLTKKLLAFSRNESSDIEILNINKLIQDVQHMLEKTLTVRIKLLLKLAPDLWSVYIDESELEDAILNMSINAMHAIENNGQLTIETKNKHISRTVGKRLGIVKGDYVLLAITDTGVGMDDSTKEKIFDPFYSTKGEKGTGLGLSQVYGFVNRCGGAIKVESRLEKGTTITLFFPRRLKEALTDQPVEEKKAVVLAGKESILVVDDEPALLNLTYEILTANGYMVYCAGSPEKALKILATDSIDLVISDIIMPEMDGYALAAIIQKQYPEIKIQLSSGFSGDEETTQADKALSQNLLYKPYNAETLLERIRTLLGA